MTVPLVVTIDGPAASGKSTLAQRLAQALGLPFLDTGLLYRAVGRRLLEAGGDPRDAAAALAAAEALTADEVVTARLRGQEIGQAASMVAAYPAVRAALLPFQRRFAGMDWRGRAGRARYRHGGLPGGRGQAVRDRDCRGAGAAALRGVAAPGGRAYIRGRLGRAARA